MLVALYTLRSYKRQSSPVFANYRYRIPEPVHEGEGKAAATRDLEVGTTSRLGARLMLTSGTFSEFDSTIWDTN